MIEQKRITLVGSKSSGKSTWLGAFHDALAKGHVPRFVRASQQSPDQTDWEHLERPLRNGRYADRTPDTGAFPQVRLRTNGAWCNQAEFVLEAADYLGEEVERAFSRNDQSWTDAWDRRAKADSLVLVVRPTDLKGLPLVPPPSHAELQGLRALFDQASPLDSQDGLFAPADVAPVLSQRGDAADSGKSGTVPPTVLTLIEMLQMIRFRRGWAIGERPEGVRVAVVLTAWDAIEESLASGGPARFLRDQLTLLDDFLWSNFGPEMVRCFGLSATGGDLSDEAYSLKFQESTEPLSSVCWSTSGDEVRTDYDLSLPFAWAIAGDDALAAS